jgi:hypothetical protein
MQPPKGRSIWFDASEEERAAIARAIDRGRELIDVSVSEQGRLVSEALRQPFRDGVGVEPSRSLAIEFAEKSREVAVRPHIDETFLRLDVHDHRLVAVPSRRTFISVPRLWPSQSIKPTVAAAAMARSFVA